MTHGKTETILLKRAYDAPEAGDGVRVLVDRLWARGVSKAAARLDAWMHDLGPSDDLRTQFGHQPARWETFVAQYRDELLTPMRQVLLAMLQGVSSNDTLTLVYGARDTRENEAVVLRQYLLQKRAHVPPGWDARATLLVAITVVAAAHPDAVAPAASVERFIAPLLTQDDIASARSTLLADGEVQPASGGWELTGRGKKEVAGFQCAAAPAPT
ncbi:MAG: DUF488 family protein [Thermomicrobiales bacterium]